MKANWKAAGLRSPCTLAAAPMSRLTRSCRNFTYKLLACLKRPEVREGQWQLLETRSAWEGNPTWDRFLAFAWEGEGIDQRLLITVNYGSTQGQCHVSLPWV